MKNKQLTTLLLFAVTALFAATPQTYTIDWGKSKEIRQGVNFIHIDKEVPRNHALSEQELQNLRTKTAEKAQRQKFPLDIKNIKADVRPMKINILRVNLSLPGLSFTGLGRAPENWGKPMPESPKNIIGTLRTSALDFMTQCQEKGMDVLLTSNSGPWSPWPPPKGNTCANPAGLTISDGVIVKDNGLWSHAMFIVYKNGKVEITDNLDLTKYKDPEKKYDDIWLCHMGFGIIMKQGKTTGQTNTGYDAGLMPRMTYGLDKEHKYLYIVTIDGRQPGWSEGATGNDLFEIFTALGAYDVIDFDGGGSATLCTWDPVKKERKVYNMHDFNPHYFRPCGVVMGIYLKNKSK